MNFPYTTLPGIPQETKRPLIPMKIIHKDRETLPMLALIDSGADYSYARSEIAEFLGIDLSRIKPSKSFAANGVAFNAFPYQTLIELGGNRLKIDFHFSNQISRAFPIILGQENFFDLVRVAFERYRWNLDLRIIG